MFVVLSDPGFKQQPKCASYPLLKTSYCFTALFPSRMAFRKRPRKWQRFGGQQQSPGVRRKPEVTHYPPSAEPTGSKYWVRSLTQGSNPDCTCLVQEFWRNGIWSSNVLIFLFMTTGVGSLMKEQHKHQKRNLQSAEGVGEKLVLP